MAIMAIKEFLMNRKTGKRLFSGFIALIALMMSIGTGCPTGGGGEGSGGVAVAATAQTVAYRSVDPDGNIYQLLITETLSGAKYAAKQGDKYVLTITLIGPQPGTKTSSGTVNNAGVTLTLRPANASGTITVQISGGDLTGITIASTVKDDTNAPLAASNAPIKLEPIPPVDVYIVGEDDSKPCYWLNGVQHNLPNSGQNTASANAIAVSGSGVYIVGWDDGTPCYWLDGVQHSLPYTAGSKGGADAIAVSGSNVYIAGDEVNSSLIPTACYWLNGVQQFPGITGYVEAIAVSGDKVYIAGEEADPSTGNDIGPYYWGNGVKQSLGGVDDYASDIAVSGSDVYIVGDEIDSGNSKPCYWLNGVKQSLPADGPDGWASSIAISGGKVYIAGTDGDKPCYWLDGVKQSLPFTGSSGGAYDIAVSGSDVYILGGDEGGYCYWRSGVRQSFPVGIYCKAWAIALR